MFLTVSEGDKWKRHRKTMQSMFGPITVRKCFDSMLAATNEATDRWMSDYWCGQSFDIATEMVAKMTMFPKHGVRVVLNSRG